MKHIKFIAVLVYTILVTLSACSDKDKGDSYETNFVLEKESLHFMQQANENSFRVKSSYFPEVSCDQD